MKTSSFQELLDQNKNRGPKRSHKKGIIITAVLLIAVITLLNCFTIVEAGHTGVVVTMGKVKEGVLQEGIHAKAPFVQQVVKIDNRIQKLEVQTEAFSKDLQSVETVLAINYRVDPAKSYSIYKNIGADFTDQPLMARYVSQNSAMMDKLDSWGVNIPRNPDGSLTDRSHKIIGHTPFGRFLEPDELVGALHYLACDASKGVTGTIVAVDGGFNSFTI